jgi:hypothetical protein
MRWSRAAGEGLRERHDHQDNRRADEQIVMAGQGDHHGKQQPGGHALPGRSRAWSRQMIRPVAITAATSMP